MEDEGLTAAPCRDSDEPSNSQMEESDEMSFEWRIFGRDDLRLTPNNNDNVDVDVDETNAEETFVTIDGLLWEHSTEILHKPPDKMEHAPAEIYDEFKHLFTTPIDTMFAVLPYTFWEVMAFEVN